MFQQKPRCGAVGRRTVFSANGPESPRHQRGVKLDAAAERPQAYTWGPRVSSAEAARVPPHGLGCERPGFTWDATNTHSMEGQAMKTAASVHKKTPPGTQQPQREYLCETQRPREGTRPKTCGALAQTMKGKPLKGQGRTEDRVGGPQRGLRGGHQGLHTATTQDTGLSPGDVAF